MSLEFGKSVYKQAQQLAEQGIDANQIAKVLFDRDSEGSNYGIGIVLGGDGKAMASSATLLEHTSRELQLSAAGNYMNTNALREELRFAALKWQRVPEKYWEHFRIAVPSDAGTGAVKTAAEILLMLKDGISAIGVEELGWPAYKAIANVSRVGCKEFPVDAVISGSDILPIYQAGPMNTTGQVKDVQVVKARAGSAGRQGDYVVLDRAYSGFEFARLLETHSYDDIMRMSFERQVMPFVDEGVTFCLAVSPTKSFVSFALRPCGLLLIFCPDGSRAKEITTSINAAMRARGSAFEHPATRAFVKAMINDRQKLEAEHEAALKRVAQAEATWRRHVKDTAIEQLYSEEYAGLFRNPKARDDAPVHIYNEHIYPVFSRGRCRQNVTGIPADEQTAARHVKVFAEQCY
ncbi:MAG: aminotransferase class I/II-fold pyridoxal phosphate-dependent enzyme [Planctomycetota bacterium]|jgi:aspartate/tyrosine/aromatic aminotransferase